MTNRLETHLKKGSQPYLVIYKNVDGVRMWSTYELEQGKNSVLPNDAIEEHHIPLTGGKTVGIAVQRVKIPFELREDGTCLEWDE